MAAGCAPSWTIARDRSDLTPAQSEALMIHGSPILTPPSQCFRLDTRAVLLTAGLLTSVVGLRLQAQRIAVASSPVATVPTHSQPEFGRVASAAIFDNGGFVVADGAYRTVRFFDRAGKAVATAGGPGGGPGEFEQIDFVGRCGGDALYVFDPESARITVLGPKGALLRTLRVTAGDRRPAFAVRCNRSGSIVVLSWPRFDPTVPLGPYRASQGVAVANPDGSIRRQIGEFAGGERYRYPTSDGPRVFGKTLIAAISEDRVYVGEADSFHLAVVDFDGTRRGTISRQVTTWPVTKAEIETYMREHLETVLDPGARESQRRGFADYRFPETFPPYSAVEVDPTGLVWVRRFYAPTSARDTWFVFEPTGEFIQEVAMPAASELLAVGTDHVVARYTNRQGAHEVHLLGLTRRR